jgi:hypothetical protein
MTRLARILAGLLLACAAARAGDVIDAIVAVVNRVPVLQSQWEEALRFEALQDGQSLDRMNAEQRRAALDRLIDRTLIHQQALAAHFPEPDAAEVSRAVTELRNQVAPGLPEEEWTRKLATSGLTPSDVEANVRSQLEQLNFIDARFRPAANVEDQDIERYYRGDLLPRLRAAGAPATPLAEVKLQIRQLLVEQRINALMSSWLQNLRSQARIEMRAVPPRGAPLSQTTAGGGDR